jgi:hypothetical protein
VATVRQARRVGKEYRYQEQATNPFQGARKQWFINTMIESSLRVYASQ